jgi:hypothetical protein
MKWIKRKLRQWINEADYAEGGRDYPVSVADSHRVDSNPVLNFRIFSAQNGLILEFTSYNEKIDRRSGSTYIINEGEDVADYVRQSLPMEMLKVNQ